MLLWSNGGAVLAGNTYSARLKYLLLCGSAVVSAVVGLTNMSFNATGGPTHSRNFMMSRAAEAEDMLRVFVVL